MHSSTSPLWRLFPFTRNPKQCPAEYQNLQGDDKEYVKMLLRIDDDISRSFFVKKVLVVEGDTEQIVLSETFSLIPNDFISSIRSDWHIVRARGKASIIPVVKYLKAMQIDVYVIHDGDYGVEGAEVFNEPIRAALSNDEKLCVMNSCVEDALGYTAGSKDKPLKAYKFITDNWHVWNDVSQQWKDTIEKIFNNGNHIEEDTE